MIQPFAIPSIRDAVLAALDAMALDARNPSRVRAAGKAAALLRAGVVPTFRGGVLVVASAREAGAEHAITMQRVCSCPARGYHKHTALVDAYLAAIDDNGAVPFERAA